MKILFISLSNVGDCLLSLPALDSLIAVYPKAEITVFCGKRAAALFKDNFYIKQCLVDDPNRGFRHRLKMFFELKKEVFDLLIDLKNSALPLLLKAKYKTYPWFKAGPGIVHMRQRHLYKVQKFIPPLLQEVLSQKGTGWTRAWQKSKDTLARHSLQFRKSLYISDRDRKIAYNLLDYEAHSLIQDKFIVLSPGARSHLKRWPAKNFSQLGDRLIQELKIKVVIVGDDSELEICQAVKGQMQQPTVNLCAKTTLKSLAALIERAELVVSNDSAVSHLASYLDRPTVAIFGPTDYKKYGPWAGRSEVVHSDLNCSPCETAQCRIEDTLKCMRDIQVDEVYAAARKLL